MATGTVGSSARDYHTRQTAYLFSGTLSDVSGGNWTATTSIKIGTLPAGSSILRIVQCTSVVDNAGGPLIKIGNSNNGAQLVASAAGGMATLGPTALTVVASTATVILASDTDVWVTNNSSAAAATSGVTQVFVEFCMAGTTSAS